MPLDSSLLLPSCSVGKCICGGCPTVLPCEYYDPLDGGVKVLPDVLVTIGGIASDPGCGSINDCDQLHGDYLVSCGASLYEEGETGLCGSPPFVKGSATDIAITYDGDGIRVFVRASVSIIGSTFAERFFFFPFATVECGGSALRIKEFGDQDASNSSYDGDGGTKQYHIDSPRDIDAMCDVYSATATAVFV